MNKKPTVIVIDDDPDIVTFLTVLLEDNGYNTISAVNGQEGLDLTQKELPDLVLLDVTMPEKSGVKCYREMRENPNLKTIPIVIVTGVTEEFRKFIYSRRQVPPPDGYLSKPVNKKELLEVIARLIPKN